MDTIIETESLEAFQTSRQSFDGLPAEPKPEWLRGDCPKCGRPVVSNTWYVGGCGYLVTHDCYASLGKDATCDHRRIL